MRYTMFRTQNVSPLLVLISSHEQQLPQLDLTCAAQMHDGVGVCDDSEVVHAEFSSLVHSLVHFICVYICDQNGTNPIGC